MAVIMLLEHRGSEVRRGGEGGGQGAGEGGWERWQGKEGRRADPGWGWGIRLLGKQGTVRNCFLWLSSCSWSTEGVR